MLELKNVRKIYTTKIGDVNALDGINFTFPEKGLIFIIGRSGSGKTTMLNVVGGLDGFDEGEIIIDGKSFSDLTPEEYDSYRNTFIGVVFQEYNLLPEYTVEKNIKIATELQGVQADEEELDRLMDLVGIREFKTRLPSELSGGQMQRVAIARALIKNPQIILADEPTGALDSATGIQVIEMLKNLSKEKLVIVVSHDLELAEKYADRILTLKDGKIIDDVTIDDVTVKGNVYDGKTLCVRSGAELTSQEKDIVADAIKNKKEIEIIESISIREKKPTKIEKIEKKPAKDIQLVSSKMKLKSAAELGVKSLTVKPIRLIITILLAVIAFGLFGVFSAVASYSRQKIVYYNLAESGFSSLVVDAEYVYENGDGAGKSIKLSQDTIDEVNKNTGYSFRGISYLNDYNDTEYNPSGAYGIAEIIGYEMNNKKQQYYKNKVYGTIEFDDANIVETIENSVDENGNNVEKVKQTIKEGGFNFEIIEGKFPKSIDENGEYVGDKSSSGQTLIQGVGISSYLADSIMQHCSGGKTYNGKQINSMADLIGQKITFVGNNSVYIIECIIDVGEIPARYEPLKLSNENQTLTNEFESYLYSSANLLLFTDKGLAQYHLDRSNRVTSYYSPNSSTRFTVEDGDERVFTKKVRWYCIDDLSLNNYFTFDQVDGENGAKVNVPINENEILVNANKLGSLFIEEIERIPATDENGTKAKILALADKVANPELNIEVRRQALIEFMRILEITPNTTTTSKLGTKITSMNVTINQKFETSKEENNVDFKIVGVYFDVDTNYKSETNWFFAVNKADLHKVIAYAGQGSYVRMISPIVKDSFARRAMSKAMDGSDGLVLNWYGNTTLEVTKQAAGVVQKFFDIFFYFDIVLAFFAVFLLTNYISTSIIQKRQTIGILRALGSNSRDIFRIFIIESLVIAIFSGLLATVFGYVGCSLVNFYVRELMSVNISFAIFEISHALIIFFGAVITATLASLIPILKICKRKPVELIRKSN